MNINPEFNSPERPDANMVMSEAMGYLFNKFIKPQEGNLEQEELDQVAIIGIMLKEIAEKAEAYYQLQEQGYEKNPYSKN